MKENDLPRERSFRETDIVELAIIYPETLPVWDYCKDTVVD